MKLYTEKKHCCGCGACKDACPMEAIELVADQEGFLYPQIDEAKCVRCGRCEQVCPIKEAGSGESEGNSEGKRAALYLGAQARSDAVRHGGSSGGVFPLLAGYVFQKQGVVYGAAYDNDMRVVHREAYDKEELERLRRTKYVQSDLDGIYCKIETQLKAGKWVLFCGVPCQAQALRLFLGREYQRLILVDLVCYGVPSPGIWAAYVKYLGRKSKGRITEEG